MWRNTASEGQGGSRSGSARELCAQELQTVAALLQRDNSKPFEAALSGRGSLHAAIRSQLFEGARSLGLDPGQTRMGEHDEDAIDMVGLMFESLLETHALAGQARGLFARLVMSYVRIALTDENLFVRPDHPARRLLDALALSCESNDGGSPQDRELLERASATVSRVVADYNEDMAIFELATEELQACCSSSAGAPKSSSGARPKPCMAASACCRRACRPHRRSRSACRHGR